MSEEDANVERLTVPLHEEVLEPHVHPVETGRVRIHKRVESTPVEMTIEAAREEVTIERVPVDRPVDAMPEPRQEGDTLIIPVVEEVVVTETRLVVREEVRVTRRRVTDQVPVQTTVRREVLDIDDSAAVP